MRCRFCGENLRVINQTLYSSRGEKCTASQTRKHVGLSEEMRCVYCGGECKTINGRLFTKFGKKCPPSPTKAHCLQ